MPHQTDVYMHIKVVKIIISLLKTGYFSPITLLYCFSQYKFI